MRRFILIDQSITGEGGHYLSYACAVMNGAIAEGFLPVLCVNYRFGTAKELPYRVYPAFRYTSLESTSSFRLRGSMADAGGSGYLWGGMIKPAIQRAARIVFGARYQKARAHFFPHKSLKSSETAEQAHKASCFMQDFLALLSRLELCAEDIVFFPTLSIVELHGLEQAIHEIDCTQMPSFHLLFRWNPFHGKRKDYGEELEQMSYERECFGRCEDINFLHFYTDSERLAEQYNCFSKCRFSVLPIPHTGYTVSDAWQKKSERTISYLGDARPEKGFLQLPRVINALARERVQFQVQANYNIPGGEGGVAKCRKKLRNIENVALFETALNAEKYSAALKKTDIMLILYDPEQYYARSSGIFAEAMAAGIPALVPADTWMSAQVCKERNEQLGKIAAQFGARQFNVEITNGEFVWKNERGYTAKIILRFIVNWANGCDSICIQAAVENEDRAELGQAVDYVERERGNECFALFSVPKRCNAIKFHLNGTYEQKMPKIYSVEVIELCANTPEFGGICRIFDSYDQCGAILRDMIEHYPIIRRSTEQYSKKWSMFHNAGFLINLLK